MMIFWQCLNEIDSGPVLGYVLACNSELVLASAGPLLATFMAHNSPNVHFFPPVLAQYIAIMASNSGILAMP